jgi:anti-sigma B factor antagonist
MPPSESTPDLRVVDGISYLGLPQRLDASNARGLLDVLRTELSEGHLQICVDCGKTESIDSTALGVLIQGLKRARAQGGELVLANVGDAVRMVLAITRVDRVCKVFETSEAASLALRGQIGA